MDAAMHDQFLAVLQAHKGLIYKVAHAYCNRPGDRQDLIQEIILQLWRSFGRYSGEAKYSTWMYRIALNTAISYHRKESRKQQAHSILTTGILDFAGNDQPPDVNENLRLLQHFIAGLKELDKALMLLYLEEKSQKEIADIMGISESNVSTRVSRIKQILKQKFLAINA